MDSYPFSSFWINGRLVSLSQVANAVENPQSPFEEHTFNFIRLWFSGHNEFDITTSGSTGEPKRIKITRNQMVSSAKLTHHALELKKFESCLICIDTKYIGGMMMLVRAFTIGLKIYAVDPCANPLQKIPVDQWVSFAAFVPYQVENILESKHPHLLDTLDTIIIGGAPLSEGTIEKLQSYQCVCYATYGMTETISHVALKKLNGKNRSDVYRTLPGITIDIDARECIMLNVPYLSEPVITNDIVDKLSATSFIWKGRFDNIINSGGVKIVPEKVERVINDFMQVSGYNNRVFVHGIPDQALGTRVVLVMEANKTDEDFLSALNSFLAGTISPYEIPKDLLLVPRFQETENGKINRLQTVKGFVASIPLKKNQH